jgi:hypothetical protein
VNAVTDLAMLPPDATVTGAFAQAINRVLDDETFGAPP